MKDLIGPEIEAYAEEHSAAESDVCRQLREETYATMERPQMLVGPLEGAFLKMMLRLVRATRVLEIGMFTGYSALSMAEALPDGGQVTTCEIDPQPAAVARKYFARSPHGRKIDVKMGPALDTLRGLHGPYDLVFIDADKANYVEYYERALDLVAPEGVILVDNVLWNGDVLIQPPPDRSTAVIQELNRLVAQDERVTCVLATIRDGVLIIRPKTGQGEKA
jgi:caffeoyl-CoA O-methyltransferase